MNTTALLGHINRPEPAAVTRLWLDNTVRLLRAVGRALWNGLYTMTKARILLEHGSRRPARRL
jgi:hypothetical protein